MWVFNIMALIKHSREDLKNMDSSSLLEQFFSDYYIFQWQIDHSEASQYNSREQVNQAIRQEYQNRTKALKEEINRRFPVEP